MFISGFSKWLNARGKADNDELHDRLKPEQYFKLVVEWLGVRIDRAQAFIQTVQRKLAVYGTAVPA